MRTITLQIATGLVVILALCSCSGSKNASDAFGNFEADDQLISSEIAGKLLSCNFEEGMTLSKGAEIAVVDTVPILLQISQLESQLVTIQARRQSVKTQLDVIEQQKKNVEVDYNRVSNMLKDGAATQTTRDGLERP